MQKSPGKPKAVIFDLDGTLIDTIQLHALSFQRLFLLFGKKISSKKIMPFMRLPTEEIYAGLHVKKELGIEMEKFIQLRREVYYSILHGKKIIFKDVFPALKILKRKKFKLAIATNSSRRTFEHSTNGSLLKYFDATVSFSEVLRAKPDPEMLLKAASKLHVKPSECIMIGDSVMDVVAARRAGMKCIALCRKTGASTQSELFAKRPFALARSILKAAKIIEGM